jgi:Zn-dependent protease
MARRSLFTLFGIPVRIDVTFLVVVAFLGLAAPTGALVVAWMVVVTISVLVHEFGHAIAFRLYGHAAQIQLYGFGGVTTGARLGPKRDVVVSLAGPISAFVLLGIPAVLIDTYGSVGDPFWTEVVKMVIWVNVFWSLVNLLPVLPLDGGNVTQALLSMSLGRDAERLTRQISIGFAAAGAVIALVFGSSYSLFLVVFAGIFGAMNWSALSRVRMARINRLLAAGQQGLIGGDTRGAAASADAALAERVDTSQRASAIGLQTWAWLQEGNVTNARIAMSRWPNGRPVPAALQAGIALAEQRAPEAVALLSYALVQEQAGPDHFFAAIAMSRADLSLEVSDELLRMEDGRGLEAAAVFASLLHHGSCFTDAARVGSRLFDDGRLPRDRTALGIASSLSRGGHLDAAARWLETAADYGWRDIGSVLRDSDFDGVRTTPGFIELSRRLAYPATA